MNEILWQLPVPVTGIIRGPRFQVLTKRQCSISFSIEAEDGSEKWISLRFEGVEVYKCVYLTSLASVPRNLRTEAYGKLIEIEDSAWLSEINEGYDEYHKRMPKQPLRLHHFMILFDDGPCYEFICTDFKSPSETVSENEPSPPDQL